MPDAPRKYTLITEAQLQAARQHWPKVSDKTWVLVLKHADEPLVLNRPTHRGMGFVTFKVPPNPTEGMFYRSDVDVLILISGDTPLAR